MPNPSRDEIAMAVVRAIYGAEDRVKRGELVPPKDDADETRWTLFLGEIVADAILALLAPPVVATAFDVPAAFAPLTFGPIGPVERDAELDRVLEQAKRVAPPTVGIHHRVFTDPPVPHPQTAEPDAWMATTTGSQPKEGDEHE